MIPLAATDGGHYVIAERPIWVACIFDASVNVNSSSLLFCRLTIEPLQPTFSLAQVSQGISATIALQEMSSDWATCEHERIQNVNLNNTGQALQPSAFQGYGIRLLSGLIEGSTKLSTTLVDELSGHITESGQSPKDLWHDFLLLLFSAAMSTPDEDSQKRLVDLVFALAHYHRQPTTAVQDATNAAAESASLFSNLTGFGWIARDYWNGE